MEDNKTTPNPQPSTDDFTVPVSVGGTQPKPSSAPDLPVEVNKGSDITSLPVAEPKEDIVEKPNAPVFSDIKPASTEMPKPAEEPASDVSSSEPSMDNNWAPLSQEPAPAPQQPEQTKSLAELASEEETKNPIPEPQSALHPTKKHGKGRVILVAVLLLLSLAGGAGYAYYQQKKGSPAPAASTAETQPAPANNAADPDQTAKDIDATLQKVDDTKDFSENDLSDAALNL